jgi:hypothetical protein
MELAQFSKLDKGDDDKKKKDKVSVIDHIIFSESNN